MKPVSLTMFAWLKAKQDAGLYTDAGTLHFYTKS